MTELLSRRGLFGLGASVGALALSGCDRIAATPGARALFEGTEHLTGAAQRLITNRHALAPEYSGADLSPVFRSNGTAMPDTSDYAKLLGGGFADWRLKLGGLVAKPLSLSLPQLTALPTRTQITRHDCVEGWSAIGQWNGVPLNLLLNAAMLSPQARYIVFHCYDRFGGSEYYESVDLIDAFHPQTILAWALNGRMLPVQNGAPLRLRVERQLGYKQAKYLRAIEAVASLASVGKGKGGTWEDEADYAWYAGI